MTVWPDWTVAGLGMNENGPLISATKIVTVLDVFGGTVGVGAVDVEPP